MLSRALRGINFKWVFTILLAGVLFSMVTLSLFLPVETFAQENDSNYLRCDGFLTPIGGCLQIGATAIVNALVALVSLLLYLAGLIFDTTLEYSIETNYNNFVAVQSGWIMFRDLINLLFIFILLYIAFGTVLRLEKVNWKKQLVAIIIAAILVNFSLFLTRLAIDASNIVSLGLYQQVTKCEASPDSTDSACVGGTTTISSAMMHYIGLPKSFSMDALGLDINRANGLRNGLIRLGLIIIVAWAFFSVALLFIVRTVVFVFLLVTSPIGVAGASLPMLKKPSEEWRENLFSQAVVAPIFLLIMYVVLVMAGELMREELAGSRVSLTDSHQDIEMTLDRDFWLNFVLMIGFIVAAVRITKRYSGEVGKMINGAAGKLLGTSIGLVASGAALAGRQTMGRSAASKLKGERGQKLLKAANAGNRNALRDYNILKSRAEGTYDIRSSKLGAFGAKQASKLGGVAGITATTGSKAGEGGRLKRLKEIGEEEAKQYEDLSPEAIRSYAKERRERGEEEGKGFTTKGVWSAAAGANKARAKALEELADKRETSKDEREKRVSKAADKIRSGQGNPSEIKGAIANLKPKEIAELPPSLLTSTPELLSELNIGDMQALKENLDRGTMESIVRSNSLSQKVKDWVDDPKNGFPDSRRPVAKKNEPKKPSGLTDQYGRPISS